MSLESTIADLVASTNELTNQVMQLLGGGIGARKIIYCTPGGTGSGETPESPCTLQCAIDNIITDGAVNEIRLLDGEHVITNNTTILDKQAVILTNYQGSAPVVCSPNTVLASISEALPASKTCIAHNYSETPLVVERSTLIVGAVEIRGTDSALKALHGRIIFNSALATLKTWVPSATKKSAAIDGYSATVTSTTPLTIKVYHPDYVALGAEPTEYACPMYMDNSNFVASDYLYVHQNAQTTSVYATAIRGAYNANIFVRKLSMTGCTSAATVARNAKLFIGYAEMAAADAPLKAFASGASNCDVALGGFPDTQWPTNLSPNVVRVTNTSLPALSVFANSRLSTAYVNMMGVGAAGVFLGAVVNSDVFLSNYTLYAYDRAANSGFETLLLAQESSRVSYVSSNNTLRNSGADTLIKAYQNSTVTSNGNTSVATNDAELYSGARWVTGLPGTLIEAPYP